MDKKNQLIISTIIILFGNFLYALTVKLFIMPVDLITGGVTGISLALGALTEIPVSVFAMVLNVIMLILGFILIGKKFALTTVLSTFSFPIFLGFCEKVIGDFILTDDIVICTIFSGLGVGMALGIVIRQGSSTGGIDVIPLALNKYFRVPVSLAMNVIDVIILVAQVLVFPIDRLMYGIVGVIMYTIVLDKVLLMGSSKTEIKIISEKSEEIKKAILEEVDRGVTVLHGEGGFSGGKIELLLSVVSNREVPKVEKLLRLIDPDAFMIVSKVTDVRGKGFTAAKIYGDK